VLKEYDLNGDGWLNADERAEARKAVVDQRGASTAPGGGNRRGAQEREPAEPGPRVSPDEVKTFLNASLYDSNALRTIFLTFENDQWEAELQDFYKTDVEVPASLTVDGESYAEVGVGFRGASSFFRIPAGHKRSFNISIDLIDEDQRLYGYKTLNLLNANGDASLLSSVLYSQLADDHMVVPKANFMKVVVNGEYWGVYVNVQQFDKIFTKENFGSSKGTRWKVPGSPRGDGGLAYDGEELEPYKERYDMKSDDGKKAWNALVELCRVLNETPLDQLEKELEPHLNIDQALWFLAYDVVLGNSDGYWTRASDYYLFRDKDKRFQVIPHDMNEAFRPTRGGRGGPQRGRAGGQQRGPGAQQREDGAQQRGAGQRGGQQGGMTLDPLVGLDQERKPLRSRLLAVPELRERYLANVREIARTQLDWSNLGPMVAQYRELIDDSVAADTRKLDSHEAFLRATTIESEAGSNGPDGSLQSFAQQRRDFLLNYEPSDSE